ncbi:MAG: hypothetical protein AAGF12_24035 [Myxococcota bacterium]
MNRVLPVLCGSLLSACSLINPTVTFQEAEDASVDAATMDATADTPVAGGFVLVRSAPSPNMTYVEPDVVIELEFNMPVDVATLEEALSLTAAAPQSPVAFDVELEEGGRLVRLLPREALSLLSDHRLVIAETLANREGGSLAAAVELNFQSRDGTWSAIELLESHEAGDARPLDLAGNLDGFGIAAWIELDGNGADVWARRFDPGSGWLPAESVEDRSDPFDDPRVGIDPEGNGFVFWRDQNVFGGEELWVNRFRGSWSGELRLVDQGSLGFEWDTALDGAGNAFVIYPRTPAGTLSLYTRRFTPALGWSFESRREPRNRQVQAARITADAQGNAAAFWIDVDDRSTWTSRFTPVDGWSAPEELQASAAPREAIATGSGAIQLFNSSLDRLWAFQFRSESGWSNGEPIDDGNAERFGFSRPAAASNDSGSTVVVWTQSDGALLNIWANTFMPGSGWGTPVQLDSDNREADSPDIAIDPAGNALAIWDHGEEIWYARFTPAEGWQPATALGPGANPKIAADRFGRAIAGWTRLNQGTGFRDAVAARFE